MCTPDTGTAAVKPTKMQGTHGFTQTSEGFQVYPEAIAEKSYLEQVTDYIQDVVPLSQSLIRNMHVSENSSNDTDRKVLWCRFDTAFVDTLSPHDQDTFLSLGYINGYSLWRLNEDESMTEVMSATKTTPARIVKVIDSPKLGARVENDPYAQHRPLVCVASVVFHPTPIPLKSPPHRQRQYDLEVAKYKQDMRDNPPSHVRVFGMGQGLSDVRVLRFRDHVTGILSSQEAVVVCTREVLHTFTAATLEPMQSLDFCGPVTYNLTTMLPVDIGVCWLAYASKTRPRSRTSSEESGSEPQATPLTMSNMAETATSVAHDLASGIAYFGDIGLQHVQQYLNPTTDPIDDDIDPSDGVVDDNLPGLTMTGEAVPGGTSHGTVIVRDTQSHRVVAHFKAHDSMVGALGFDRSGSMLVTADQRGFKLNVYRIFPAQAGNGGHHLLYTLNRGLTSASMQSLAFSHDSRWLAVTTGRGTTHIYPVHPCGGPLSSKTHAVQSIGNNLSFPATGALGHGFTIRHDQSVNALSRVKVHAYSIKDGAATSASATESVIPCAAYFMYTKGEGGGLGLMIASKVTTYFEMRAKANENVEENSVHSIKLSCTPVKTFQLPRPQESRLVRVETDPMLVDMEDNLKSTKRSSTWLSNIEINTYQDDVAPLWHSPQFSLKQYKPVLNASPDVTRQCIGQNQPQETVSVKIPHHDLRPSISAGAECLSYSPDRNGMWGIPSDQKPISEDQLEEKLSSAISESLSM